jgi:phosphoglycerol transferase MdoB-like AlkP superfamily enzyme
METRPGAVIFDMLPFCLYFVAGVITGFHVYTLLTLTVYGVPFNPLELVALLGSLCLLIAAYVSLFKPYAAARLALLACLAMWCFYGPAIAKSIRTKHDKPRSVLHGQALLPSQGFGSQLSVTKSASKFEGVCLAAYI